MKSMKTFFISVLLLYPATTTYSQQDSITTLEDFLELVADESVIDQDDSQILDLIELLLLYPVNINEATVQDLLIIPFIDAVSAQRIIEYRNKHGNYFSKQELNSIKGLNSDLLKILKPLITVADTRPKKIFTPAPKAPLSAARTLSDSHKDYRLSIRSRAITDLQERRGFEEGKYLGSRIKSYFRLRGDYQNRYSFSGLIEKDAGERSFTDFYSASLSIRDVAWFNQVIVGDFLAEFGQGLVLWSPYAFSKGSDAVATVVRKARNFSQYTSTDENLFFRGVALSTIISGVGISGFVSVNKADATLLESNDEISALSLSGLHRTESEILKKDVLQNMSFALRIDTNPLELVNFSLLHLRTKFDRSLVPADKSKPAGDSFSFTSASYDFIFQRLRFSGEVAYNSTSVASVNSLSFELTKSFSAIVLLRSYPRNFTNLYGKGFGESSRTQNEFGIYTGFRWQTPVGNFNVYYDQFKFPFATTDLALPINGNEIMINYSARISKGFFFSARYKNELKEIDETINNVQQLVDKRLQRIRTDFIYNVNKNLRLKSRLEYSNYSVDDINQTEEGFLFYQDIRLNLLKNLRLYSRLVLFQSDSFNSRLYEFENDLTGVLSNPALFGEGIKWYVLIYYNVFDYLRLSIKYSELHKPNEETLSSGLNLIKSNTDDRLSIQIDYSL